MTSQCLQFRLPPNIETNTNRFDETDIYEQVTYETSTGTGRHNQTTNEFKTQPYPAPSRIQIDNGIYGVMASTAIGPMMIAVMLVI